MGLRDLRPERGRKGGRRRESKGGDVSDKVGLFRQRSLTRVEKVNDMRQKKWGFGSGTSKGRGGEKNR